MCFSLCWGPCFFVTLFGTLFWDTFLGYFFGTLFETLFRETLICLAFLSVEAHAEAEGIDGEWEDYCRTLLCRDGIERLQRGRVSIGAQVKSCNQTQLKRTKSWTWESRIKGNKARATTKGMVCFGDMEQVENRYSTNWTESGKGVGSLSNYQIIWVD